MRILDSLMAEIVVEEKHAARPMKAAFSKLYQSELDMKQCVQLFINSHGKPDTHTRALAGTLYNKSTAVDNDIFPLVKPFGVILLSGKWAGRACRHGYICTSEPRVTESFFCSRWGMFDGEYRTSDGIELVRKESWSIFLGAGKERVDDVQVANFGYSGLILLLVPILTLIFWIAMLVAVFQIRNSNREMSNKLNALYRLMVENKKSP